MVRLQNACEAYAMVACQKNAQCVPPADSSCSSKQVADCLATGTENGPKCVSTAAQAIEGCTPTLQAMTCANYCSQNPAGFVFCFAPCVWLCP